MEIGDLGLELIKHFEGLRVEAYRCPAGIWTIGYGHTQGVYQNQKINVQQAETLLKKDLIQFEYCVSKILKVSISQPRFDALVSFAFNVGCHNLEKSTLMFLVNQKLFAKISKELLKWDKVNGVSMLGLTRRRLVEGHLWDYGTLKFY